MLFFNTENRGPDSRHEDLTINEVLAAFKEAVQSGEHDYVTLEWLPEPGRAVTAVKDEVAGTASPPPAPAGPAAYCGPCARSGVGACDDFPDCPGGGGTPAKHDAGLNDLAAEQALGFGAS